MSRIAIMQPYFLPYLGYWQLIHAVDRFVVYDDVNYMKGGWVNRNRLLINGRPAYITLPLSDSSPHKRICDINLLASPVWRGKLIKMVQMTYRRSPCFSEVFPVIEKLIRFDAGSLSGYLLHQLQVMAEFMEIDTEFVASSRRYGNSDLSGQARVLDICNREGASIYVNLPGGQSLYDSNEFRRAGMDLRFIAMRPLLYKQESTEFVPYLSIVDALMAIGPTDIKRHLGAFDFIVPEQPS